MPGKDKTSTLINTTDSKHPLANSIATDRFCHLDNPTRRPATDSAAIESRDWVNRSSVIAIKRAQCRANRRFQVRTLQETRDMMNTAQMTPCILGSTVPEKRYPGASG